ncbi:MAG: PqqD family protein [Polyangiaceae bacterium]
MLADSTKISRSEGVLSRVLDGEAVLLDTQGGAYFGLNAVGTRAWELIGAGTTRAALIDALLAEHEVTRDILERDVDDLLRGLADRKLVHLSEG